MKKIIVNSGRSDARFNIETVEAKYNAKFVGQFCLRTVSGGWSEEPADVYYAADPNRSLGHTNYFGLITQYGSTYITKGDSGVEGEISAVRATDGEIIYSRCRHDYNVSKDKSAWIDGGRDYTRGGTGQYITIKVIDGEFYEMDKDDILVDESK